MAIMPYWVRLARNWLFAGLLLLATACSQPALFKLPLAHLNDTHSHLEPTPLNLTIHGEKSTVQVGGFARLKTAIDQMRADDPDLVLLHGGDAVQGTLYFTLFNGVVEFDFLNQLGIDAMTFGNHEFDRGTAPIPGWIRRSRFPWLSSNIDFSGEPEIAGLVKPYLIKQVHGENVAIIGVTTETTPLSTLNVGKAVFKDAVAATRQQVAALSALGINKIILLSHLGYEQDKALASQVAGIDVIVGGHSHSLLGDMSSLALVGLTPVGPYPTEIQGGDGKRVLVLQAWQWGDMLGNLQIYFTPEGEIDHYTSKALLPIGSSFTRHGLLIPPGSRSYQDILQALHQTGVIAVIDEDSAVAAALDPYTAQLGQFRKDRVAVAANDITIGLNSGPGVLAVDSMRAAVPQAQSALLNFGGVRKGFAAGVITVADVLEVMPFGNSLVLVDLTGSELKQALEEMVDFLITKYGIAAGAMPYFAGGQFTVQLTAAKGARIRDLKLGQGTAAMPVQPASVYRIVVNAFLANGGDGAYAIKHAAGFRDDTGIIDSDVLRDYLKKLGTIYNPTGQRVVVVPAGFSALSPAKGVVH